ncbi:expressed unknown protein [Seminavis robusta]|uniref:PH domain-containing protein n=1 Tax=Seminavis robusta TaxID=568900 RepID=A0A9N8DLQ7_9STRA|nr:expressed unknown protein [Seminavis robusta]|eukprot:Sro226_g092100.1 n/a (629) ;mRNA; f:70698-72584
MSSHFQHHQHQHQQPPIPVGMLEHHNHELDERGFVVNPSSREIALGWLEQWRRSKLSKAWKRVLVSLVKGQHSMTETSLCVWRQVISETTGTAALELLQQIPLSQVQWVDYDTNIHAQANFSSYAGSAGGEDRNRFAISLFQAQEDVIFRSIQDPQAIRDWVTTLKTVQQHIQNAKHDTNNATFAFAHSPISTPNASTAHQSTSSIPKSQPDQVLDLLSFDNTTQPTNSSGSAQNPLFPDLLGQQTVPIYHQQHHQQPQSQSQNQPYPSPVPSSSYPQPNTFGRSQSPTPPLMQARSMSPTRPPTHHHHHHHNHIPQNNHQNQNRSHSPPPLSFHNNPYARQPQFIQNKNTTPAPAPPPPPPPRVPVPIQQPTATRPTHLHQPQWNHTQQPRPQQHPSMNMNMNMNMNNNRGMHANNHTNNHHTNNHHHVRAHTPPPRAKPPPPVPRPTSTNNTARTFSQPTMPHQTHNHHHHHKPPTRSNSAPLPQHDNNDNNSSSARQADIKRRVIQDWALQPPQYCQLKPLAELIRTIPKVFPPHATYVPSHAYFEKWDTSHMFDLNTGGGGGGNHNNHQKVVRKLRFFLHPDKLPKDFSDDQVFLCKVLWDVVNDAQQQQQELQQHQQQRPTGK